MIWHSLASSPPPPARGQPSLLRRTLRYLALLLLLAWLLGAVLYLRADGSLAWTVPRLAQPPAGEHNLALYRWGPTLRASSYLREPTSHHHPGYLVDGHATPSLLEKWTSHWTDRAPWTEILFREPHHISRVAITHAGAHESSKRNVKSYRIVCLTEEQPPPALSVRDNVQDVVSHPFSCHRARGVRIEWSRRGVKDKIVRVYEVEVWGR